MTTTNALRSLRSQAGARSSLASSAMLTGVLLSATPERALATPGQSAHHPSAYEENRLDRAAQLAFDASLSDIVLVATMRSVSTIGIPVDTTGNAFLRVPLYSLEVQRTLKGTVPGGVLLVVGTQNGPRPRIGFDGSDTLPAICFLYDVVPLPATPTPMQRARSRYYGFMTYGRTSRSGYFTPSVDSMSIFEGMLSTAVKEQSIEQLTATAEVIAIANVSGSAHDCGLPDRRRYCQEARVTEVLAGDLPDTLIHVTSQTFRGVRQGSNLLFLRRLEYGVYRVEGAAAGAKWFEDPTHLDMSSTLLRVREIIIRRDGTPR